MAGKLFNSSFEEKTEKEIFTALMGSWFSRIRSTLPMVVGSKNEGAVLKVFSQLNYVEELFDCGLLESEVLPWLAASPDALATICFSDDCFENATVKIKTRVSKDKIAAAEQIAQKYNNKRIQLMIQLCVVRMCLCCYIVAQPGTNSATG
jgi:hypothetical protein